jgi:hypothetical protein
MDPKPGGEQRGIVTPPVRRVRVDLGVQGQQFVRVRGGLSGVKQAERDPGRRHGDPPASVRAMSE